MEFTTQCNLPDIYIHESLTLVPPSPHTYHYSRSELAWPKAVKHHVIDTHFTPSKGKVVDWRKVLDSLLKYTLLNTRDDFIGAGLSAHAASLLYQ